MIDKEKLLKKFGENLKESRNKKGLSQEKLALSLGFDRTYISMLERGKRNPSLFTLYKISNFLDSSVSNLAKNIKWITALDMEDNLDLYHDMISINHRLIFNI